MDTELFPADERYNFYFLSESCFFDLVNELRNLRMGSSSNYYLRFLALFLCSFLKVFSHAFQLFHLLLLFLFLLIILNTKIFILNLSAHLPLRIDSRLSFRNVTPCQTCILYFLS